MEIKINEPCHENWEAMTPNQQGAFCKSCMKNVVDFSKKSVEEIKDFFSKPQEGRVCGRFEEKQLQELSFDDFFSRFTYWNFTRKFAVIFFVVFGFWIFSNTMTAQEGIHLKGEVAYVPDPKPVKKDTVKTMGQAVVKARPIMGKVKCTRPAETKQVKKDTVKVQKTEPVKINNDQMVVGMVAYIPEEKKVQHPVKNIPVKIENNKLTNILDIDKPAEDNKKVITNHVVKTENSAETIPANENHINVFPNPSNGSFTIECKDKRTMHMIDENGKLVMKQEVSGSTLINAEYLKPGMYTITLIGNGKPVTKKIIITH